MWSFRERFKKINLYAMIIPIAFIMLNDWVDLLYDFARSAKIKCGGFDWTKFHTFKHVHLSLISVVYLLYFDHYWHIFMHMLMYKYLKNNSLITCILWNQGYFGHFDCVMCFSCGGSQVGPIHTWWSFSGDNLARRKARWQALKVTSGCKFTSGSNLT